MPTLLPFRDYSEHDVINLFAWSGTIPVNRGTFVKPLNSGWRTDETDTSFLGSPGATYGNTVSVRYGTTPAVGVASTGDNVIGMLLWDVKETDENGEKLIFKPRKAAEMQVAISGKTVPIVTRGIFLHSGNYTAGGPAVTAGAFAYVSGGDLMTTASNADDKSRVGKFLGAPNGKGHALLYLNI